jgi:hypothetical protein
MAIPVIDTYAARRPLSDYDRLLDTGINESGEEIA